MSIKKRDNQAIMTYADLIKPWFYLSTSENDIFTKIFSYLSLL
jgi:hypothetical protein